ncbi:MAG: methyltransferase domain-containing protein [Deltaproteobacteria bacterium]|nr:methyltransferase domain-containing protein [Deltaproteobacteria bacterium]MBN2688017.1 methyltransferase domain-containing protein [Deltaproteobacteria bacterium]
MEVRLRLKNKIRDSVKAIVGNMKRYSVADAVVLWRQWREFKNASDDMRASWVESLTSPSDLLRRFHQLGVPVVERSVDIDCFEKWMDQYPDLCRFYSNYGDTRIEKILEHYLTMSELHISGRDVCIDIAASTSPFADVVAEHLKNTCYRQDLIYPEGIHGNSIGGDAARMPVDNNFADVLTLHCAYECFQDDADIRFITEAERVLRRGGRLGIIPLYVESVYFVKTGPLHDRRRIKVEEGARCIWRDDGYVREAFSRHYSPESLKKRVVEAITKMNCEVLHFTNLDEVGSRYPGQRVYCRFMFRAVRR